jgi:hypothetical protein
MPGVVKTVNSKGSHMGIFLENTYFLVQLSAKNVNLFVSEVPVPVLAERPFNFVFSFVEIPQGDLINYRYHHPKKEPILLS